MTLALGNAAEGEPILASDLQQVFHHVNATPGCAIFENSGSWSVPEGVHKFRVTLIGAGGGGYTETVGSGEDMYDVDHRGGDGTRARCDIAGVDIGTTYTITIGAGGGANADGGASSFGANFIAPGGVKGSSNTSGAVGGQSATFPAGSLGRRYMMPEYTVGPWQVQSERMYFGAGGRGNSQSGRNGLCIIEW